MSDTPALDLLRRRLLVRVVIDDEAGARAVPTRTEDAASWLRVLCCSGVLPGIVSYTRDAFLIAWHVRPELCLELLVCGPTFDEVGIGEAPRVIEVRSSELSWRPTTMDPR